MKYQSLIHVLAFALVSMQASAAGVVGTARPVETPKFVEAPTGNALTVKPKAPARAAGTRIAPSRAGTPAAKPEAPVIDTRALQPVPLRPSPRANLLGATATATVQSGGAPQCDLNQFGPQSAINLRNAGGAVVVACNKLNASMLNAAQQRKMDETTLKIANEAKGLNSPDPILRAAAARRLVTVDPYVAKLCAANCFEGPVCTAIASL